MHIYVFKGNTCLIFLVLHQASESLQDWQNNQSFDYQQEIILGRKEEDTHTGQIKAKQSKGPTSSLSGFIILALKSLKSSKISLCS